MKILSSQFCLSNFILIDFFVIIFINLNDLLDIWLIFRDKIGEIKKHKNLLNNQKRGGLTLDPRNFGTFNFFPGDKQLDKPGLLHSEAGYLFGDSRI